ncbi:DUF4160 domain-containing protein [Synechocystis salina LEGE 06155]|nr:DUF4160 domain-containing protein [Synechocystis salina LEGE 06155]
MPTLSVFYGIIFKMYYFDNQQHHVPHIHAEYGDSRAVFDINDGEILAGELPKNKRKLVEAWIEIHREDLMANWRLAVTSQEIFRIDPLK